MKRIVALILLVCATAMVGMQALAARVAVWEPVELREEAPYSEAESLTVKYVDGGVVLSTNRATEVRIYSILGQLISKRTIQAGSTKLTLNTKGVFILKTDNTTLRLNF